MKLVGLACAPPARVGLRLTLDEYAQYAPLPDLEENGFERAVMRHGLENFTEAATASLRERGFSTSVTWKVHGESFRGGLDRWISTYWGRYGVIIHQTNS